MIANPWPLCGNCVMGMFADFYAGAKDGIIASYLSGNSSETMAHSGIVHHADFRLNFYLYDFELLSECVFSSLGLSAISMTESADEVIEVEDRDCLIYVLTNDWVRAVAAFPIYLARSLAVNWFQSIAEERNEESSEPSEAVVRSIQDLVGLCNSACHENLDVLFICA